MKSNAEEPSNSRPTLVKVERRSVVRIARRLTLMDAGLGRFPLFGPFVFTVGGLFVREYIGVISLIVIAMTRDLLVQHRIHTVYRVALPLIVIGQLLACVLSASPAPAIWTTLSHRVVGL
jgi:hypothetical protein